MMNRQHGRPPDVREPLWPIPYQAIAGLAIRPNGSRITLLDYFIRVILTSQLYPAIKCVQRQIEGPFCDDPDFYSLRGPPPPCIGPPGRGRPGRQTRGAWLRTDCDFQRRDRTADRSR